MSKEFSELNGYGVKDAVARADIEQLKESGGGTKLYKHFLGISTKYNGEDMPTIYASIICSKKEAFTNANIQELDSLLYGEIGYIHELTDVGSNDFLGIIVSISENEIVLSPATQGMEYFHDYTTIEIVDEIVEI